MDNRKQHSFFLCLIFILCFFTISKCNEADKILEFNEYIELEKHPGMTSPLRPQFLSEPLPFHPSLNGTPGFNPAYGAENPKVILYFFFDLQCPVCFRAWEPLKWLARNSEFTDELQLVFLNNALPSHIRAKEMAKVLMALSRQGLFWEGMNLHFIHRPRDGPSLSSLVLSKIKGIDKEKFEKDLEDKEIEKQIDYETSLAGAIGASGTPAFVINGIIATGWGSYFTPQFPVKQSVDRFNAIYSKIDKSSEKDEKEIYKGIIHQLIQQKDAKVYEYFVNPPKPSEHHVDDILIVSTE